MRERWLPVGLLGAALVAINLIARLVARLGPDNEDRHGVISLVAFAAVGLTCAGFAHVWSRRHAPTRWTGDIGAAALGSLVIILFVGPFVSGTTPFADGAGVFFLQIWQYAGFVIGGAGIGYLIAIALGQDHRSKQLARYVQSRQNKPRRVTRP